MCKKRGWFKATVVFFSGDAVGIWYHAPIGCLTQNMYLNLYSIILKYPEISKVCPWFLHGFVIYNAISTHACVMQHDC